MSCATEKTTLMKRYCCELRSLGGAAVDLRLAVVDQLPAGAGIPRDGDRLEWSGDRTHRLIPVLEACAVLLEVADYHQGDVVLVKERVLGRIRIPVHGGDVAGPGSDCIEQVRLPASPLCLVVPPPDHGWDAGEGREAAGRQLGVDRVAAAGRLQH